VPSTLALELATNPFLRTREPGVVAAAEGFAGVPLGDETAVFTALRRWKDERYD
jgi:hydroxyacylglutathione hydrolase